MCYWMKPWTHYVFIDSAAINCDLLWSYTCTCMPLHTTMVCTWPVPICIRMCVSLSPSPLSLQRNGLRKLLCSNASVLHQFSTSIFSSSEMANRKPPLSFTTATEKPCKRNVSPGLAESLVFGSSYPPSSLSLPLPPSLPPLSLSSSLFHLSRYVSAQKDRVTVIFSTVFTDDDDVIIGKVFMQVYKIHVCTCTFVYKIMVEPDKPAIP